MRVKSQPFDKPLVLWHLVPYGLSTEPRDKGLRTPRYLAQRNPTYSSLTAGLYQRR